MREELNRTPSPGLKDATQPLEEAYLQRRRLEDEIDGMLKALSSRGSAAPVSPQEQQDLALQILEKVRRVRASLSREIAGLLASRPCL